MPFLSTTIRHFLSFSRLSLSASYSRILGFEVRMEKSVTSNLASPCLLDYQNPL